MTCLTLLIPSTLRLESPPIGCVLQDRYLRDDLSDPPDPQYTETIESPPIGCVLQDRDLRDDLPDPPDPQYTETRIPSYWLCVAGPGPER